MPLDLKNKKATCPNQVDDSLRVHRMAYHTESTCLPVIEGKNINFHVAYPVVLLKCLTCGYTESYSKHQFEKYIGMSFEKFKKNL